MPPLSVLGTAKPMAMRTLAHMLNISLERAEVLLVDIYGFNK